MTEDRRDTLSASFNEPAFKNQEADNALSQQQAMAIFDMLAGSPDIAFGFQRDGCYARAHMMCRILQKQGFAPQKAWAFEMPGQKLASVDSRGYPMYWSFHVAAALPVRMNDGTVQNMVFDPAMFDGPATLREWGDAMKAHPAQLHIAPFGQPAPGHAGNYTGKTNADASTDRVAAMTMKAFMQDALRTPRVVMESAMRRSLGLSAPQGKNWVTAAERCAPPSNKFPEP